MPGKAGILSLKPWAVQQCLNSTNPSYFDLKGYLHNCGETNDRISGSCEDASSDSSLGLILRQYFVRRKTFYSLF
jgi:hypothetical protein